MAIYIVALDRGGYSASGGAYYDPRPSHDGGRCVRLDIFDDEVVPVTAEFGETPTEIDYEEDGVDISAPVISGNTLSFQIQGLNANGSVALLVSFASGAARRLVIAANENQPLMGSIAPTDDDDDDPGAWG